MRKLLLVSVLVLAAALLALPAFAQVDPTPVPQDADPTATHDSEVAPTTVPALTTDEMFVPVPQTSLTGPTTADFIRGSFVNLSAALDAAGMADLLATGQVTVFAPNDGAFITLLNDLDMSLNDLLANQTLLQNVLAYHVVPGIVTSSDILNGVVPGAVETSHGAAVTFGYDDLTSRVTLNDGAASIEQADIYTSTGIVHIIDNVLMPPTINELSLMPAAGEVAEPVTGQTIENISENSFVVLTAAVRAAGLSDELSSGEYTLFAPNDGAFLTLLNDLDMSYADLLANQTLLQNVLTYHLVPGTVTAEQIQNGVGALQTVNGATLSFGFNPATSRVTINNGAASVEQPNIFATNGVVHIIDNVLLPPQ